MQDFLVIYARDTSPSGPYHNTSNETYGHPKGGKKRVENNDIFLKNFHHFLLFLFCPRQNVRISLIFHVLKSVAQIFAADLLFRPMSHQTNNSETQASPSPNPSSPSPLTLTFICQFLKFKLKRQTTMASAPSNSLTSPNAIIRNPPGPESQNYHSHV